MAFDQAPTSTVAVLQLRTTVISIQLWHLTDQNIQVAYYEISARDGIIYK